MHLFSDGRDVEIKTSLKDLKSLVNDLPSNVYLATLMGRYYAMDRDKRWERTRIAYEAIANGAGKSYRDPFEAIQDLSCQGVTDEFIEPVILSGYKGIRGTNDCLIFCNFRADRARQILHALTDQTFHHFLAIIIGFSKK